MLDSDLLPSVVGASRSHQIPLHRISIHSDSFNFDDSWSCWLCARTIRIRWKIFDEDVRCYLETLRSVLAHLVTPPECEFRDLTIEKGLSFGMCIKSSKVGHVEKQCLDAVVAVSPSASREIGIGESS